MGECCCSREGERTLVVVGNGRVTGEPDIARITFSVGGERFGNLAAARTDSAERMQRCLGALAEAGIAERDLRTGHFIAGPEYEYRKGRQEIVGYAVRNSLDVTVRNLEAVGEVIDRVMGAGASSLDGPRFELEDSEALGLAAHAAAARDARAIADVLAETLGVAIAGVQRIAPREMPQPGPFPVFARMAMAAGPEAAAPTPVQAGTIEVSASVEVTFLIG